jgi:hypothetical protein
MRFTTAQMNRSTKSYVSSQLIVEHIGSSEERVATAVGRRAFTPDGHRWQTALGGLFTTRTYDHRAPSRLYRGAPRAHSTARERL